MKDSIRKELIDWIKTIIAAIIISIIIESYIVGLTVVNGESMLGTIQNNDRLLINKFSYSFTKPKRGDIIVFVPPIEKRKDELFIKRVVAVEGDEFSIENDVVYINNKTLHEDYIVNEAFKERKYNILSGVVPKGYVFVLGDNRNNSNDSRAFGFVPISNIKGKAVTKVWPFDGIKTFAVNYVEP